MLNKIDVKLKIFGIARYGLSVAFAHVPLSSFDMFDPSDPV